MANDFLNGGAGADVLNGGAGTGDWANYREGATAGITINLLTHAAGIGGTAQGDSLTNIENLQGTRFVDVLTGDANNNILSGGEGADVLNGGDGTGDWAYYNEGTTAGVTLNLATGSASDGDMLSNIENILGSGFNDTLTGDTAANVLSGAGGDDILTGGGGGDSLRGGQGNDTLTGDAAARDFFYFEDLTGTDTVTNFFQANVSHRDALVLDLSVFSLGAALDASEIVNSPGVVAAGAFAQFIYDVNLKALWFDLDGMGGDGAIHIAALTSGLASLSLLDFGWIA